MLNDEYKYRPIADMVFEASKRAFQDHSSENYLHYQEMYQNLNEDIRSIFTPQLFGDFINPIMSRAVMNQQSAIDNPGSQSSTELIAVVGTPGSGKTDAINKILTMSQQLGLRNGLANWEDPQTRHPDKRTVLPYRSLIDINNMAYQDIRGRIPHNKLLAVELPAGAAIMQNDMLEGRPLGQLTLRKIIRDSKRSDDDPLKLHVRVNMVCLTPGLSITHLANPFRTQGAPEYVIDQQRKFQKKRARRLLQILPPSHYPPSYIVDFLLPNNTRIDPMDYPDFVTQYGSQVDVTLAYLRDLDPKVIKKSEKLTELLKKSKKRQRKMLARELVMSLAGAFVLKQTAEVDLGIPSEDAFYGLVCPPIEKVVSSVYGNTDRSLW